MTAPGVVTARQVRIRLGFTMPELWTFLAVALPVVATLRTPLSTIDAAYTVAAGRLMIETGAILRADPFTFTLAGQPWLDQQWLAQLVLAGVDSVGGWAALAIARAILVGAACAALLATAIALGCGRRLAALLTLVAFLVAAPSLALRAQLLAVDLAAASLLILAARRSRPRLAWLLPAIACAWANVHGTFPLLLALVAAALLEDVRARRPWRGLAAVLAVSALATCLTPWGPAVWTYALALPAVPAIRSLAVEWQPSSLLSPAGALFYLSVLGVVAVVLVAGGTRLRRIGSLPSLPSLVLLGGLGLLGVAAQRATIWWALAALPVVASLLVARPAKGPPVPTASPRRAALNAAIAVLVVAVAVPFLPAWRPLTASTGWEPPLLSDAPAGLSGAVRSLVARGDRLFVPQEWGSWFELEAPGIPVFVDSRLELYPPDVWEDYYSIVESASDSPAARVLARRGIVAIVLTSSSRQVRDELLASRWRLAYADADGMLMTSADSSAGTGS